MSGDLASRRYVHGHGRGGHRERDFPPLGRRMADVGHLRAGAPVGVPLRGAGVLLPDNDRVHAPCRGHHDLRVPDHGERNARGRLFLSCHGLCPCPFLHDHLGRVRDGLGVRSGDVPNHRDDGESVL